ncbi:MAG: 50S ribosomal protein L18 [Acidobacteriota bacterium]
MSDYQAKRLKLKRHRRQRSHGRLRNRVKGTSERPRLAVFKSLKHFYAQVIDDAAGRTLASASTLDKEVQGLIDTGSCNRAAAAAVGATIAERAKAQGVESVVFDRGGFIYHGKIQAVADAAREKGLKF